MYDIACWFGPVCLNCIQLSVAVTRMEPENNFYECQRADLRKSPRLWRQDSLERVEARTPVPPCWGNTRMGRRDWGDMLHNPHRHGQERSHDGELFAHEEVPGRRPALSVTTWGEGGNSGVSLSSLSPTRPAIPRRFHLAHIPEALLEVGGQGVFSTSSTFHPRQDGVFSFFFLSVGLLFTESAGFGRKVGR